MHPIFRRLLIGLFPLGTVVGVAHGFRTDVACGFRDEVENPQLDQAENPQLDQTENPQLDQAENPQLDQAENPQLDQAESDEIVPAALPGPCVDPTADALRRFAIDGLTSAGLFALEDGVDFDLDSDGTIDTALSHVGLGGSGGYSYHLYVRRGACGHWLGMLHTQGFEILEGHPGALAQLALETHAGSNSWLESRARFDGSRYQVHRERQCRLLAESSSPVCDAWESRAWGNEH